MRSFTEATSPHQLNYKLRPAWARYGVMLGCVVLGWLGRAALTPTIGPTGLPFIFFFPAVVIASWYGGLGAGVLATILSAAVADWAFIPPVHTWSVIETDEYHILFFIFACGFIVCALQEMHRRTAQALNELEARQQAERQNLFEAQAARRLLELGNRCRRLGDNSDRCLAEILEAAIELTCANKGTLQLFNTKTDALVLAAHRGFERPFVEFFASVHHETPAVCGAAMRSAQRVIVKDVTRSEIFANQPCLNVLLEAGVRAVQSTPLVSSEGKIVGMISTHFGEPHQPGERELRFMDLLARQAADYIERKEADETETTLRADLEQQLDRLHTLLGILPVGVWIGNSDCSEIRGNPSAYRMMGFDAGVNASVTTSTQEIPAVRILVNGKEVRPEDAPMQQVARSGKGVENIEHEIVFPDGTRKTVYASIAPLLDENGAVREVIAAYSDFSDRKRAEQRLLQSEERFRALVSIMTDITWRTDSAGHYVTPQHSWEKFTGQTWDEHRGSGWVNAVHPEDRERVAEIWRQACEARKPYESRGRLWHAPSQSWHYYVARAVPLLNADGSVREWVGCDADVHEQKMVENALRESEQRVRQLLALLPVGVYTINANGEITYYNDQAAVLWGRRPNVGDTGERWCGSFRLWMPDGSSLPHDRTPMAQVLAEGRSFRNVHVVMERPPPDSSRVTVLVNIDPILDHAGHVVGAINVFHDVTALRETENALQEALKAKDRFLASVSHELRTPLTPALMMTDILQQNKTLPQSANNMLDVISRNLRLEAKLVNDLLDLSRAITGKLRVERKDCDVHLIVEQAVHVCSGLSDAKQINIQTKLNATHRRFPADGTRLQQVFWNLIHNAIKFTPLGGSITISSRDQNGRLCVEVSDTGCGIEPANLQRIFEPFAEEKPATSTNGHREGLGLGLSIARSIVAAHGGTLVAASDGVNRGATFTVSIPVSQPTTDFPMPLDNESPKNAQHLAGNVQAQPASSCDLPA